MSRSKTYDVLGVAAGTFALYAATAGPSLVPYRDAGEMATSIPLLGILHPTSYPLYSIGGFLFGRLLPWGNSAYRLNLFSALAMAGAWALVWWLVANLERRAVAYATIVLGALSYHFWWHALVSEMYALNVFFIVALLLVYQRRQLLLWGFIFGLGLANRSDLLLTLPAFALGFWRDPAWAPERQTRHIVALFFCIAAGLGLYLFLPLRAAQQPLMNWDDPSNVERFLRSVLRRGYGGGLDLLSSAYATGENFFSEMQLYVEHLWRDYSYIGLPLALAGVFFGRRRHPAWTLLLIAGWTITGPVFIFLGNLPPNTHAVAILEAAYLMPDVFFLALAAMGIAAFLSWRVEQVWVIAGAVLIGAASIGKAVTVYPEVNQRHNFLALDFNRNTYASLPAPALVVGRSDVPLFTLYYGHWGPMHAVGRIPIAQGLAGSPWYQTMIYRDESGLNVNVLKDGAGWTAFAHQNSGWGLYAAQDIDWPADGAEHFEARGLVNRFMESAAIANSASTITSKNLLRNFYVYRDTYIYGHYRDFFSNELIEAYAKAWMRIGDEDALRMAMALKPDMPYAPFQLAYLYYARGDFATAARYYARTLKNFDVMEQEADAWKTFPALKESIQRDHNLARTHWKAVQQRLQVKP